MAILTKPGAGVLIQGITGREARMVTQHSLAYGTRIVAGVTPGRGGEEVLGVPLFDTVRDAARHITVDATVIYVPPAMTYDAVAEATASRIPLIVVITERVPQHDALRMLRLANGAGCRVIGPNSVGMITPSHGVKLGAIGGDVPTRCFVPGRVGVISRSGGMTAECSWMVKRAGFGVSTAISIGGDPMIGSTPTELLKLYQDDPETDAVVMWGEPGTSYEEDVADFIAAGGFTKPLIAYVAGRFVESMPEGTVFGHAAAMIQNNRGRPSEKVRRLRAVGAHVPDSFNELKPTLEQVLGAIR